MVSAEKKIELAQWLLDPDKEQTLPHDLALLEPRLRELGLYKIYEEIELPLVEILDEMHKIGIKVDAPYLEKLGKEMGKELDVLVKKIYKLAGGEFNLNSPKQLGEVLFDRMKIDAGGIKTTRTGQRSTDAETLELIKDRHPIVESILHYREIFKITSTYVEPLRELADKHGRVHTTFVQTGTATGRLSSQNPNMQNIPIVGEWGKEIRRAFIAEKKFSIATFDYSQIELRVLATVSGDPTMIEAFNNDLDIHQLTASQVYQVPLEKVTKEMRAAAKTLNFGVSYGMGPQAFAKQSGLSVADAKKFIDGYFANFAAVKKWQQETIAKARVNGYVENASGRRRWLPNINWPGRRYAAEAERIAINMPIQGLAADIIKIAMIRVADLIDRKKWGDRARLLLSIHDELLLELSDDILEKAMPLIQKEMEGAYRLAVPLKVNSASGRNWGEA